MVQGIETGGKTPVVFPGYGVMLRFSAIVILRCAEINEL